MTSPVPEHEKLFDEISNKLSELSQRYQEGTTAEEAPSQQQKLERMQGQLKRFQTDMQGTNEELLEKIKSLENVNFSQNEITGQLRQITEQLNHERMTNSKLSADLAKSLELCLQLQLEIQGLKARAMAIQTEEKKFSNSLMEKNRSLQRDLELAQVLKDEIAMEMAKAKSAMQREQNSWLEKEQELKNNIASLEKDKSEMLTTIEELNSMMDEKDQQIMNLTQEFEKMSASLNEVEGSAIQQHDVLKNLMSVAESKIVEMKLALDKKHSEAADYYSHLQKALAQVNVLNQENLTLKDYVAKLNYYHQQTQAIQAANIAQGQVSQQQQVAANQQQQ
jgi:chromosome segregation ATPase